MFTCRKETTFLGLATESSVRDEGGREACGIIAKLYKEPASVLDESLSPNSQGTQQCHRALMTMPSGLGASSFHTGPYIIITTLFSLLSKHYLALSAIFVQIKKNGNAP